MIFRFPVGISVLLIALAGCASTSTASRPASPPPTAAAQKLPCVTASRIPSAPCSAGRAYSSTDLERTGEIDPGDALQKLDPSITVQHH